MNCPGRRSDPSLTVSGPVSDTPPLCGRRLLVVDDEEVIRQIVQGFLGVDGWEVDSVSDADDAFTHFESRRYPVVICDVHLPGNSTDLLRRLKAQSPATQVIMFTGDPSVSTVREALQHGAYEYVTKPCRREELAHIVQRAYEKYCCSASRRGCRPKTNFTAATSKNWLRSAPRSSAKASCATARSSTAPSTRFSSWTSPPARSATITSPPPAC